METSKKMLGVAIDKQLRKEYANRVVYLGDGEEFQLMLFNPTKFKIAASISLNGVTIPNMVTLRPGERIWLDRYLDRNAKFKFCTYDVENTEDVKEAISNNGKIKVQFFYEETAKKPYMICDSYKQGFNTPISTSSYIPNNITWVSTNLYSYSSPENNLISTCAAEPNAYYSSANKIETGRIDEGGASLQRLTNDYSEFSSFSFATEEITILPISQKPFNKKDIEKKYCVECGKRLNPKYKYCPVCGTKIE